MDTEVLIDAVRERRPIWDATSKLHSNRDCIRKLWNEISYELDIDCEDAKKKWRGLRENYRKELQKERTTQAAGGDWKSKWSYYDSISFLQDQVAPHQTPGSTDPSVQFSESSKDPPVSPNGTTNSGVEEEEEPAEGREADKNGMVVDISSAGSSTFTNQTAGRAEATQKRPASHFDCKGHLSQFPNTYKKTLLQKMVQLEGKKDAEFVGRRPAAQEVHDADYYFLMSLWPSLRAIPAHRKMFFRRKMEYLFLKEECNAPVNVLGPGVAERPSSAASDDTVVSHGHSAATSVEDLSPNDDKTQHQHQDKGQG